MTVPELIRRGGYEVDPTILARIEARERRKDVNHDVLALMSQEAGTYGVIEPVNPGDEEAARTIYELAPAAFANAFGRMENEDGTAASYGGMAMSAMQTLNEEVAKTGKPVRATFVHFFQDTEGGLKAVTASIGGGHVYNYDRQSKSIRQATLDQDGEAFLDGSNNALDQVVAEVIDVQSGDRLSILNTEIEYNSVDGSITEKQLQKFAKRRNPERAASKLVGRHKANRDKVAIVMDILDTDGRSSIRASAASAAAPMAMQGAGVGESTGASVASNEKERSSWLRRKIPKLLGVAAVGLGAKALRNKDSQPKHAADVQPGRLSALRNRLSGTRSRGAEGWGYYVEENEAHYARHANAKGLRKAGVYASAIPVSARAAQIRYNETRRERWENDPRYANLAPAERDRELRKRDGNRKAKIALGLLVVSAAYPLLFDPGSDRKPSFLWLYSKENDEGIDMAGYPFMQGDQLDGDGWGYDVSPGNRSPWGNDDPTIGHVDQSNDNSFVGDILPAGGLIGDGDGLSPPSWWPDEWGGKDATRVWDPGSTGLGPDGQPINRENLPRVPEVPPVAPPVVPPVDVPEIPPVNTPDIDVSVDRDNWQPAETTVPTGGGAEELLHDWGHQIRGVENFDGANAHNVAEAAQAEFGEDWLRFANGTDATYIMPDGNIGIRAPGEVRVTDEEIRRFIYDRILEEAKS